jgi:hypothetical protein
MSSRLLLSFALAASCVSANAVTLLQVISPVSYAIADTNDRRVVSLDGKPVFYCGYNAFAAWARPLVGQPVASTPQAGMTVTIDGREVSLERLMIARGWLQPSVLDDDAQAAITEGRGGWACASAATPFELMHTVVDPKILAGIALNESGLNGHAWPWTLNVAGRGYFFRSREDAYRAIELLLVEHRCDFDVGIMQVNWCYHGYRFASPWEALAPAMNIRVAEDILNENYRKTHSVVQAVAYYHSANPAPGQAYLERFKRHLSQIEAGL